MRIANFLLLIASIALSACTGQGHYPLSGDVCGPTDPVLDMHACDFTVPNFLPAPPARAFTACDGSAQTGQPAQTCR